jgi:hypothetical protein
MNVKDILFALNYGKKRVKAVKSINSCNMDINGIERSIHGSIEGRRSSMRKNRQNG